MMVSIIDFKAIYGLFKIYIHFTPKKCKKYHKNYAKKCYSMHAKK